MVRAGILALFTGGAAILSAPALVLEFGIGAPDVVAEPTADRAASPGGAAAQRAPVLVETPKLVRSGASARDPAVIVVQGGQPLLRPNRTTSFDTPAGQDRYERARVLQRELTRVGCYAGETDGDWGGASKRAMLVFLERVNATLPVDEPDQVLLALVKSQRGTVCADTCQPGEATGLDGRCTRAQVAQASPLPRLTRQAQATPPTTVPSTGQTSTPAPVKVAVFAPPAYVAPTMGRAAPPAPAPLLGPGGTWKTDIDRATDVAAAPPQAEPLPGKMALGVPAPAEPQSYAPVRPSAAMAPAAPAKPVRPRAKPVNWGIMPLTTH